MPDAELVRQALAGRTEAYADLARRWAARITAVCHARVGRADAADDLAQETLLRGFRALATLADPAKFGAWLCGIASRTCLDWLKARDRSQIPFSALAPEHNLEACLGRYRASEEASLDHEDELRQLMREVEALPEEYRKVILLYYYQDLTYRELARLLGVSPATVNARLTRARALLRRRLTDISR
jgi:RNA polymerase sigma-70 factor (ECF subfamily)